METHRQPVHTQTAAYHLAKDRLELIEARFRELQSSDIPLVQDVATYLLGNGGKRLRPALVALCAQACGYEGDDDIELGVIVEFIHTASLVHDDIVDDAVTRRGNEPANRVWGNQLAVLFGDFLYARSLALSVSLGKLRLVEVLTEATSRLVEGEMLDVLHNGNAELGLDTYMDIIDRKTASLFAGCAQAAGVLAEVSSEQEAALATFGHDIGIAFQLIDDLLDYAADPDRLGKQVGADLREGKMTYPLIHLLENGSAEQRAAAMACLGDADATQTGLESVLEAMRATGSLDATREAAARYAEQARTALSVLPPTPARDALGELPQFVVNRGH
ncbi:MAG: octaprenyl diphosphate synthase [Acidobacteria bacterium]|nr:octaprenyl diphosphate synthase [Acidobacteriota bacterium]